MTGGGAICYGGKWRRRRRRRRPSFRRARVARPKGAAFRQAALLEFDAAPKTVTLCRGGGLLLVPAEGGDAVEVPSFGGGLDFAGARVALAQGEVLLHRDGRLTVRNAVFVDARRP
jgi:hypothetical protein